MEDEEIRIPRLRRDILGLPQEKIMHVETIQPPSRRESEDLEVDPNLKALFVVDWEDKRILENEIAVNAIQQVISKCHPSLLQYMIKLIEQRIRNDFRLFMNMQLELETLRKLKELGDYTYVTKKANDEEVSFW